MSSPRNFVTPSHILNADDIMVFFKGTKKNLHALMSLFQSYGEASGHSASQNASFIQVPYLQT